MTADVWLLARVFRLGGAPTASEALRLVLPVLVFVVVLAATGVSGTVSSSSSSSTLCRVGGLLAPPFFSLAAGICGQRGRAFRGYFNLEGRWQTQKPECKCIFAMCNFAQFKREHLIQVGLISSHVNLANSTPVSYYGVDDPSVFLNNLCISFCERF